MARSLRPFSSESPPGKFNAQLRDAHVPVTRVPSGLQEGLPSRLDLCLIFNADVTHFVHWDVHIADHALLEGKWLREKLRDVEPNGTWHIDDSLKASCLQARATLLRPTVLSGVTLLEWWRAVQECCVSPLNSRGRNRHREPPGIKAIREQLRTCTCEVSKSALFRELRRQRAHFLTTRRLIRCRAGLRDGRAVTNTSKLNPLTCMQSSDETLFTRSHTVMLDWLSAEYARKWDAQETTAESVISRAESLFVPRGVGACFGKEEIWKVLHNLKKKTRCDHYGLCIESFLILFSSDPTGLTSFLNSFATDPANFGI